VQRALGNYQSAVAQLGKARADVARYAPLVAQHALSAEQLANARAAVQAGIGNVQAAKGALEAARLDLAWTDVRSPIDGVVGLAQTRVGNLVTPSQVLTTVSTLDPIRASFSISEREYLDHAEDLKHVDDPQRVNRRYFELLLLDGRIFPERAKRVVVNRQLDPSTGTLTIQALLPNPGNVLRPGLNARIRLHTGVQRDVLMVPERAVQQLQGTYRVAVVGADQHVRVQPITVGSLLGHDYVVTGGLQRGDRVVVDGQQNAQPGALVHAEEAPAGETAAAPGPPATGAAPQGRTPPPTGRAPR
jgi:membrane fusion protein (multidrug efflux system)